MYLPQNYFVISCKYFSSIYPARWQTNPRHPNHLDHYWAVNADERRVWRSQGWVWNNAKMASANTLDPLLLIWYVLNVYVFVFYNIPVYQCANGVDEILPHGMQWPTLNCIIDDTVADGLVTEGAMISAAMVLISDYMEW